MGLTRGGEAVIDASLIGDRAVGGGDKSVRQVRRLARRPKHSGGIEKKRKPRLRIVTELIGTCPRKRRIGDHAVEFGAVRKLAL